MQDLLIENHLDHVLFKHRAEALASVLDMDTHIGLNDSMPAKSNMPRLGQIGIFSKSTHFSLISFKQEHQELFEDTV